MPTGLFYLLTYLPSLPELGGPPPIGLEEVSRLARETPDRTIGVLFEVLDLEDRLQKLALVRLLAPPPGTGTTAPAPETGPLPPPLAELFTEEAASQPEETWLTAVWSRFYEHVASLGDGLSTPFLARWSRWEKSLRDQMADHRSRNLGGNGLPLPPAPVPEWDHSDLIREAVHAEEPLAAERLLDEARWHFLDRHAVRFSFRIEELIAYILKLRLLQRYARLDRKEGIQILKEVSSE